MLLMNLGYDGVYGKPVFDESDMDREPRSEPAAPKNQQKSITDFS